MAHTDLTRGVNAPMGAPPGAGSNHPGGVHVLMANGETKFLSGRASPKTLRALSTMSGGEEVSDGEF